MFIVLTWLVRWLHVIGATIWVGGYALIVLVILPLLRKWPEEKFIQLTMNAIRVLTFAGTLTIIAGATLIYFTRGYDKLFHGEWGWSVIAGLVIALALMGIGDSALRPALRRLRTAEEKDTRKIQRLATLGLVLGIIVLAIMTRMIYART